MNTSPATAKISGTPAERLAALGIALPPAPPPIANFVTHVIEGNILYLSGQGPREADGFLHTGKVGGTVGVEDAYKHARLTGINLLAVMQDALGDLSRVKRVVKLLGMVNAVPDFLDHPSVINALGGRLRLSARQHHRRDRSDRRPARLEEDVSGCASP